MAKNQEKEVNKRDTKKIAEGDQKRGDCDSEGSANEKEREMKMK